MIIAQKLGLRPSQILAALVPYYFFTMLAAFLDGLGMMLLVSVFSGATQFFTVSGLPMILQLPIGMLIGDGEFPRLVVILLGLFGINLVIRFGLTVFDGAIGALLRRKLQETVYSCYIRGDWSHMRGFRVGDAVGSTTQEAMVVSKYMLSAVSAFYYLLGAGVIGGLALLSSLKVSLFLGGIAMPLMLLMKMVFSVQARLSHASAALRNEFSSDITDRFNGLLQVHVDNNVEYHLTCGLRTQPLLTRLDIKIGICQAAISTSNNQLLFSALLGFALWLQFFGSIQTPELGLIAGIGVLGLKVAGQLSGAIAAIGNLSRLSGSLYPVINALNVPPIRPRQPVPEPVVSVEARSISYSYGNLRVIDGATVFAKRKEPLILHGRSGNGKTTLANLLAGLYFPTDGHVHYIGESGKRYSGRIYSAKIGFVTQDIYLFRGTLRDNLAAGRSCTDEAIWRVLEQVDAADFVRQFGGLDTESAEAGRSLSGGQRRRLGVARVLLSGADILIFDEVTAGLDQANKAAVIKVIERLSECYVVVLISHDPLRLIGQTTFSV